MLPITSDFTALFPLDLNPPRLGLFRPTVATIFSCLEARSEILQSQSERLNPGSPEELERALELAKISREYREAAFAIDYEMFGQVLSSLAKMAICLAIACYSLGSAAWQAAIVGLFLSLGGFYAVKLYLQAQSAYQFWFQAEAVAEILQRAKKTREMAHKSE